MIGRNWPFTTLLVLAMFAASGMVILFAYGDAGPVALGGEPPLIKASALPLKRAPDDPGGQTVAELGGVGDLLTDQPEVAREERLMPTPEQPLSPAEAAIASLGRNGEADAQVPNPEERIKAKAALEALVSELRSGEKAATPGGGVGGPKSATTDRQPTPSRPSDIVPPRVRRDTGQAQKPNEPENRSLISAEPLSPPVSGDVQVAAIGDVVTGGTTPRFQGTPGGRFRVQLAAVREEEDAKRAWSLFQDQLGQFVGGLEPYFERAETSNGTFYRVQIGPFSDSGDAASLCVELKKRNASCFVVNR